MNEVQNCGRPGGRKIRGSDCVLNPNLDIRGEKKKTDRKLGLWRPEHYKTSILVIIFN